MKMMNRLHITLGIGVLISGMIVHPAQAHHSFAMFDQKTTVTIEGTVNKFEWTNPHVFLTLDVTGADGKVVSYLIEGGSVNIHKRAGWAINSFKAGDRIKVSMYPLNSGQPGGRVKEVTLPDGKVLSLTSGAAQAEPAASR